MSLLRGGLLLASIGLGLVVGCSEDTAIPDVDESGPTVAVLYPPSRIGDDFTVSDSVEVYLGAADNDAVEEISAWYTRPGDSQRRLIGATTRAVPVAEIPDSVSAFFDLPRGWGVYQIRWRTLEITSGTRPQLFATAKDPSGNSGFSEVVTVFVLNIGDDLGPPTADFIVRPPSGDVQTEFVFDPIGNDPNDPLTHDPIDPPTAIDVRWDFNGDNVWDLDWDAEATAVELQTYLFQAPGDYLARLQARNTYFEGLSKIKTVRVTVTPVGGEPNPPATMDNQFVPLSSGIYPRGPSDRRGADVDELPAHRVNLPFPVNILNREVTNREYVNYLDVALVARPDHEFPEAKFFANEVFYNDVAPPADTTRLYLDLDNSRIFFDLDDERFGVEPGYEDHPITGVTWYGANAFSVRYGLRLPTEAEWEVAARGNNLSYRYPMGPELTSGDPTGTQRINYVRSGDPLEGDRGTTPARFFDGQPNSFGFITIDSPSPVGCYDVSGNAAEWCTDWYGPYSSEPLQTNPQGPLDGLFKAVRGGSYLSSPDGVRVSNRDGDRRPEDSFPSIGFRVCFTIVAGGR